MSVSGISCVPMGSSGLRQIQQDSDQLCEDRQRREMECHAQMRDLQARQQAAEKRAQACNVQAATVTKILDQVRTGTHTDPGTRSTLVRNSIETCVCARVLHWYYVCVRLCVFLRCRHEACAA